MKKKTWRCFHCDEVFKSRKSAWNHFGPDQDCEKRPPACIDPLRQDEKERISELREAQDYALKCQESANAAEDKLEDIKRELTEFKFLTKCQSVNDLRMMIDSSKGTLITARELVKVVIKRMPEIYQEVIK